MSGSTVPITANQTSTARRRAVEKTRPAVDAVDVGERTAAKIISGDTDATMTAKPAAQTQVHTRRSGQTRRPIDAVDVGEKTASKIISEDTDATMTAKAAAQTHAHTRRSGQTRRSMKPRWVTVTSILIKNLALLVVLLGFVQMIRWVVFNAGSNTEGLSGISEDFDGKFAEVEKFVKKTVTAMQVQLNAVDRKVGDAITSVRMEFDEKMEKKGEEVDLKLRALDVRSDAFEKFIDEFATKSLLSKEEFSDFFEEFKKERKNKGADSGEMSLDEIREYAREVVEKEIQRHAADGLGMVDYALGSAGAKVIRHSEPYAYNARWSLSMNKVSPGAEKMLSPSFGEPGQCFPLKGGSGFVEVALRAAIVPEAVTLEHVDKSVAYDRSSAPKQCRVSGWINGQGPIDGENDIKKFLLSEFTYDLQKSNAQTYKVVESAASTLVDTIRFDYMSNHGNAAHTCIYRLRVHGHEPSPVAMLEGQN